MREIFFGNNLHLDMAVLQKWGHTNRESYPASTAIQSPYTMYMISKSSSELSLLVQPQNVNFKAKIYSFLPFMFLIFLEIAMYRNSDFVLVLPQSRNLSVT